MQLTRIHFRILVGSSSIGKIFCHRARDLSSYPAYTKDQLVSWSDGKNNHHGMDAIGSNTIVT